VTGHGAILPEDAGHFAAVRPCLGAPGRGTMVGMTGSSTDDTPEQQPDDDGGPYGVFGEGKPRKILGESDEPPRRRPRKKA
jgi:hypothetical protein